MKTSAGAKESGQIVEDGTRAPDEWRDEGLPSRKEILAFIAREREAERAF